MTARNTHDLAKAAPGKTAACFGVAGRSGALARPRPLRSALDIAIALLLGVVPLTGASASASPGANPATGTPTAAPNPQQIDALVRLILATLQAGSGHGSAQALEGQLTFAIDQAQANCSVTQAALVDVQAMSGSLSPVARQALRAVRDTLSRCQTTGTAALRGTQGTLGQGTTLGLAGGTSNYQGTR